MQQNQNKNNNQNNKNNPKYRNTSYYKSRVGSGSKPKKETSVFLDKAKKRQMNNYKLAVIVLFLLMIVFAGLITLGVFLNSFVESETDTDNTGDPGVDIFTTLPNGSGNALNPDPTDPDPDAQLTSGDPETEISEIFLNYRGVYLDIQKIESIDSLQYFIDNIKSKDINAVNIDIKKDDGTVPYHINGQTDSVMIGESQITVPIEDIINLLHDNGIYVSGTVACFKDSLASTTFVNYALHDSSSVSMRWEDSDGNFWLNAYSEGARAYIKSIVEDSAKLGFDEIILKYFFFPDVANERSIIYEDEESGMTKYAVVKNFVTEQRHLLDNIAPKVKLGLEIPVGNFLGMLNETMGLNPYDLIDWSNFFATSFAPADVPYGARINDEVISNPESSPYETVKALCGHFEIISKIHNFRPYLQAFNGYGEQQVLNQKQALYDCDMNVWQLVNFDNYY
ncbi:MAG: putative glycoside hydrolase [Oscillospiraceae bacterium]|nr:putative glycoside hydrolase [Oscillospiraceae bacterium]